MSLFNKRGSGILLPVSALPSEFGIGDFGSAAFSFIDFLKASGQKYWQVLPLGPTDPVYFYSPYTLLSAFALNPLFINAGEVLPQGPINYQLAAEKKENILKKMFMVFEPNEAYKTFCTKYGNWLEDYALFMALLKHFNAPWFEWPPDIASRQDNALAYWQEELKSEIYYQKFLQFICFEQWRRLKAYARQNDIQLIGDLPIFVAHNSADVWVNRSEFKLNDKYQMSVVAGVPPDYFNPEGQVWNLPVYDWPKMQQNKYSWWLSRVKAALELFDQVRLDHFRGFEAYFEIPGDTLKAAAGHWVKGPGAELFQTFQNELRRMPFIAEDLGVITPEVNELRDKFQLPGMRVTMIDLLDYGMSGTDGQIHGVQNHPENCVAYSTTHDFNTIMGWYNEQASQEAKAYFLKKIRNKEARSIHWDFINHVSASKAKTVIIQMQDILGLGSSARLNFPGTSGPDKNWCWRCLPEQLNTDNIERLQLITNSNDRG